MTRCAAILHEVHMCSYCDIILRLITPAWPWYHKLTLQFMLVVLYVTERLLLPIPCRFLGTVQYQWPCMQFLRKGTTLCICICIQILTVAMTFSSVAMTSRITVCVHLLVNWFIIVGQAWAAGLMFVTVHKLCVYITAGFVTVCCYMSVMNSWGHLQDA